MQSKKYPSLKLIPAPESKPLETVAEYAKKLLDKFEPCIVWDIVNVNKIACVLRVGNRHGLFSSISMFISAIDNIGKLPGVSMTDLGSFEVGGFKHIGRGFTINDPASFFSVLLRKIKADCEEELTDAEERFTQANAAEKKAAEVRLKNAHAEFEAIEVMAKKSVSAPSIKLTDVNS